MNINKDSVPQTKSYMDYSEEERKLLVEGILTNRKEGKPPTEDQRKFQEAEDIFFEKDSQDRHGH
ncbi:MAG: hypothetical protein WC671_02995 [Candidatus Paceibacterota bacterium]